VLNHFSVTPPENSNNANNPTKTEPGGIKTGSINPMSKDNFISSEKIIKGKTYCWFDSKSSTVCEKSGILIMVFVNIPCKFQ
jgi:hypothetical protein